jgi:hypothetical protein
MNKPTREEVETWWRIAIRFFALPYDGSFKLMKESHLALLDENERLKLTLTDERSLYADLAEKKQSVSRPIFWGRRGRKTFVRWSAKRLWSRRQMI